MTATRPRVLLADDHAGVLSAARRLLSPSCEIVGQLLAGGAVLETVTRLRPDVVVLDIAMPGLNGVEACAQIVRAVPETKVIIFTAMDSQEIRQQVLKMGASAFVSKDRVLDDLLKAVHAALGEGSSA
jgi:DNA-binding NarL/FixJ family response regulator